MSDKKTDIDSGEEVAGRTIVGGRATRREGGTQRVPVGIEKVLYLAAVDPVFREALLADRTAAISREGGAFLRRLRSFKCTTRPFGSV